MTAQPLLSSSQAPRAEASPLPLQAGSFRRALLYFLPVLLLALALILAKSRRVPHGDEGRYIRFAENLTHGFFSPPAPDINLFSPPGYPLIITPFAALDAPIIWWQFPNAVLFYFAAIFLFMAFSHYFPQRQALLATYGVWVVMFYHNNFLWLAYTETLVIFLLTGLAWGLTRYFRKPEAQRGWRDLILPAFCLGYLPLTKPIFAYVNYVLLILALGLWLLTRQARYRQSLYMLLIALAMAIPYLTYTYNLTGKFMYWTNAGGDNLYWMSSPHPAEHGDWMNFEKPHQLPLHHIAFNDSISHLKGDDRDKALMARSVENITKHPEAFISNWIGNIERIFFNFPYSYKYQKLEFRFIPNMFILSISLLLLIPTLMYIRRVPFEFLFMLTLLAVYLGGSSFASAEVRMFWVIIPAVCYWLIWAAASFVRIGPPPLRPEAANLN